VAPLESRTAVLRSGTAKGSNGSIPIGTQPTSATLDSEESNQDQKKDRKNITSLKIKRAIPFLNPSVTVGEWKPISSSTAMLLVQRKKTKHKTKIE
jgi:hypothetical protein